MHSSKSAGNIVLRTGALMREAEGKKRLLMSGMRVLLAPGHESAGNGALIPRDVGVVAKVAKDGSRVRVRGPSGRHCWYAHDELQSEQELSKQQEEEAERRRDAAARLQVRATDFSASFLLAIFKPFSLCTG